MSVTCVKFRPRSVPNDRRVIPRWPVCTVGNARWTLTSNFPLDPTGHGCIVRVPRAGPATCVKRGRPVRSKITMGVAATIPTVRMVGCVYTNMMPTQRRKRGWTPNLPTVIVRPGLVVRRVSRNVTRWVVNTARRAGSTPSTTKSTVRRRRRILAPNPARIVIVTIRG